jgi:hypothetical protein
MAIESIFMFIIILILAIIISALPLYFAVLFLGGDATIFKVLITNIIVAISVALFTTFFALGGLFILIPVIIIYMFMFDLGLFKALIAWFLQFFIAVVLVIIAVMLFGVTIPFII